MGATVVLPLRLASLANLPKSGSARARTVEFASRRAPSSVPPADRQGTFLPAQQVSALDIDAHGQYVAVATMAFRQDHNFWLISSAGKLLWGRYLLPWAPFEVAILPGAAAFGVGLAYSCLTQPYPTLALFEGEESEPKTLADVQGQMGWLRYGAGDWRTGWTASLIGDLLVRSRKFVFTVPGENGPWRLAEDGTQRGFYPSPERPFRMAAGVDAEWLAVGYIAAEVNRLDEKSRKLLNVSPVVLALRRPFEAKALWSASPAWDAPLPAKLPDPALDFPLLAESFRLRPDALVSFHVAASLAVNGDASRLVIAEYGGWLWVRNSPAIGTWDPPYHAVPFLPRQRGLLRVFNGSGDETARVELPSPGLFDVRLDRSGDRVWCVPAQWFARGAAGCAWLPADRGADTVFAYDLPRRRWLGPWQFPDAVSDVAVHPSGGPALVSCWDGRLYLLDADGPTRAALDCGGPGVLRWSDEGSFAVAGLAGEVLRINAHGEPDWRLKLPASEAPLLQEPLKPVFKGVPVYSVGRVGPEAAYVGDMWLIKSPQGGILVDAGGISSLPFTWAKMRAAGVEPNQVRYLMHTHSHGDHTGAGYLWRAMGLKVVAPESAAFALSWLMPMLTDYGVWVPRPVDVPLPLKQIGDETEITLCGVRIRALFLPGHSVDSVAYLMELDGKRVAFTGDLGFDARNNILNRCWGDREKARAVVEVVRSRLLPWRPDFVFTGHSALANGTEFLRTLVVSRTIDQPLRRRSG
jgi:glyoxylase-like metal-dependent hydrolase (beta-lactamase superfamily II)